MVEGSLLQTSKDMPVTQETQRVLETLCQEPRTRVMVFMMLWNEEV